MRSRLLQFGSASVMRNACGRVRRVVRWPGLLVGFLLLRSAFMGTLENPEPRYTLECYPVVIVRAAAFLARGRTAPAI